ncbi:MAG: hypothetical protein JG777_2810 [Clostridia bacterium]|nr:hypothetical protein [Clostridia bacterium]
MSISNKPGGDKHHHVLECCSRKITMEGDFRLIPARMPV